MRGTNQRFDTNDNTVWMTAVIHSVDDMWEFVDWARRVMGNEAVLHIAERCRDSCVKRIAHIGPIDVTISVNWFVGHCLISVVGTEDEWGSEKAIGGLEYLEMNLTWDDLVSLARKKIIDCLSAEGD